jgi:glycerol kinase
MTKYILTIDQGTTSCRTLIIDKQGKVVAVAQKEFTQIFPQSAWVEHDAMEIWETQLGTIQDAIKNAGITYDQIDSIGITNQRETTVVWNRATGKPIYHAIVWQDRRTSAYCQSLTDAGWKDKIQIKTGLVIDAYFSASKVKWILDHVDGAKALAENGELAFGTIDAWLIWNLSQGSLHITDVSNASRTMIYNIHELKWDEELLQLFDIPTSMLPAVVPSSKVYGNANIDGHRIPISGIAGDQQAALFGQMCIAPGMVKNTYGTGCFMLMNTGDKAITSTNNLLTTIAWQIDGKTTYALEGAVFIAGAVVQWLRDGLHVIVDAASIEALAATVGENDGVYFVPAFAGLGAPYWNQDARGSIFGITRGTTKGHIARAALESIAYQTYDVLAAMQKDAGIKLQLLKVDGGAVKNKLLMQFQSNVLDCNLAVPKNTETTAMGAAYLAGLATGFWLSTDEITKMIELDQTYTPILNDAARQELLKGWNKAIKAAIEWTK